MKSPSYLWGHVIMSSSIIAKVADRMADLPDEQQQQQQVLMFVATLRQQQQANDNAWDVLESMIGTVELNPRDEHHAKAKSLFPWVRTASTVLITEAVLVEVGNALNALNRQGAAKFINQCYSTQNIKVVPVNTELLIRALDLYQKRSDKSWG